MNEKNPSDGNPLLTVSNFRDFGKYATEGGDTIRPGTLYRSAHLGRIDVAGVAVLDRLGIRTIIDLRGKDERLKALARLDAADRMEVVSAPVEPGAFSSMILPDGRTVTADLMLENIVATYRRFGRDAMIGFGLALQSVLDRCDSPLLIHCTAGKDRTGFTVALIQLLLGVSKEDVVDDYLLTNTRWDRAYEGNARFPPEIMAPALRADAAYLQAALDVIELEHGGIEQYAEVATGTVRFGERLREKLLKR